MTAGDDGHDNRTDPGDSQRSLFEELLDYGIYAPLGALVRLSDDLPELVEKGRTRLGGQIGLAKVLGRFAVGTARRRAERVLEPALTPLGAVVRQARDLAGRMPAGGRSPERAPDTTQQDLGVDAQRGPAEPPDDATGLVPPPASDLAIPGYDSLSASQVVPRLAGLRPDELAAVRDYEAAHRGRRTILGRIAQLEHVGGDPGV